VRLAEAQNAMQERAAEKTEETKPAQTKAAPVAPAKPIDDGPIKKPQRPDEASVVLNLDRSRKRPEAPVQKPAARPTNAQRLDDLASEMKRDRTARAPDESKRQEGRRKEGVSWREILTATDDAAPLDLGAANRQETPPRNAVNAIKMIGHLQLFTLDLETRLYGDPPPALLERFENGDRNVFANRLLRLNETDVKRRIRSESARDKHFEKGIHDFLQGFERLLEDATTSETADEELEEYLSSPLGRVYLMIGATVGYFA
jgi:hypothetical protein